MRTNAPSLIRVLVAAIATFFVCFVGTRYFRGRYLSGEAVSSGGLSGDSSLRKRGPSASEATGTDWRTFFAEYAGASGERRKELEAAAANESDLMRRVRGFDEWMRLNSGPPFNDSRSGWLIGLKQKVAALVKDNPTEAHKLMMDAIRASVWGRGVISSYLSHAENDVIIAHLLAMHPDLIHASSDPYCLIDSAVACLSMHDEWALAESMAERLPTVLEQEWARWRIDEAQLRKNDPDALRILDGIPTDFRRYKAFQGWVLSEARPEAAAMEAAVELFSSSEWRQKAESLRHSLPRR